MSALPDRYVTLRASHRFEPMKIKGSRFIACVAPIANEDDASAFIGRVRAEFDDAGHVAWAWRLLPPEAYTRSSDDGEPSGSAGRPILKQIEGHDLFGVAACVVRYFGGVKLGVGGLMRAYGGTAGQTLDRAEYREIEVRIALRVEHPYSDSGAVQAVLARYGVETRDAEYGQSVRFITDVPARTVSEFRSALTDATRGRGSACNE